MTCQEVRKSLAAYTENELLLAERGALEQHLNGCAACTRELGRIRKVWSTLKVWKPIEPTAALKEKVLGKLTFRRRILRFAVPLAAAAAILLIVFSVPYLIPAGPPAAPVTAEEAEIIENMDLLMALDEAELMDLVEDDQALSQLEKLLEAEGLF